MASSLFSLFLVLSVLHLLGHCPDDVLVEMIELFGIISADGPSDLVDDSNALHIVGLYLRIHHVAVRLRNDSDEQVKHDDADDQG